MSEVTPSPQHRSGFVNIVGNPNVGKSTLMNLLVGERVSIITSKAQTTRHRIMGIVNTPELQIVYSDTPGVLRPNYKLQESMLEFSESALGDADVLLYVTDTVETADKNEFFLERVRGVKCPVLLVINKVDLTTEEALVSLVDHWHEELPEAEIIPLSALNNFNVEPLRRRIDAALLQGRSAPDPSGLRLRRAAATARSGRPAGHRRGPPGAGPPDRCRTARRSRPRRQNARLPEANPSRGTRGIRRHFDVGRTENPEAKRHSG